MQIVSNHFLRNFFVQPIVKDVFQNRFQTDEIIRGKIIQAIPKENVFILHTKGMNLVANSRVSLFVGDTIVGKILNNKEKVELKLSEVNGKVVHQKMSLAEDGLNFTRIPLPETFWGKEAFLEIYQDKEAKQQTMDDGELQHYHLILSTESLQNIVVDAKLEKNNLLFNVWIESQELYRFIKSKSLEIKESLIDGNIEKVSFQVSPLSVDVSYFRRKWTGDNNLDIRA
jgi:hypothetical protein